MARGCELLVDEKQGATVPGVHGADGLVSVLNQMSVGTARAAIAGNAIPIDWIPR